MYKATVTFSGQYDSFFEEGTSICRKRNAPLFSSIDKFNSGCRWSSFDGSFSKVLKWVHDPDRIRTEIEFANCNGHPRHEFLEHLTAMNTRECVNSSSICFIPSRKELPRTIHEQQ